MSNLENVLGLEKRTFHIERQVIQYQPEKFDAIGEFLYKNYGVVINRAGLNGAQDWATFRTPEGSSSFFVKPGDYIVINEDNTVVAYVAEEFLAATS